jgi:uncharacterized protein YcfL|tara:strand:+ start:425 stop:619 length:195 start_codon:yes stop_codon:yes gene_type:complete
MKKKMIAIALSSILLVGCGSTKGLDECCKKETTVEKIVSKDPVMKLLASTIIIFAIRTIVTGGH